MKSGKSIIIILAATALLVWVLVALQAIRLTRTKKPEAHFEQTVRTSPSNRKSEPRPMDLPDPFLKEIYENGPERRDSRPKATIPDNVSDGPPPAAYKGLIVSSGVRAALVMQDGKAVMLRRGDRFSGFYVQDFSSEELNLESNGRNYTLRIE